MASSRDHIRMKRFYAAQADFLQTDPLTPSSRIALVKKINRSAWWRKYRLHEADLVPFSRGGRCNREYRGNMPDGSTTTGLCCVVPVDDLTVDLEIFHSIAHYIAEPELDGAGIHGPNFMKAYLEVVRKWKGPDAKRDMAALFKKHKIQYITRSPEARLAAKRRAAANDLLKLRAELTQ